MQLISVDRVSHWTDIKAQNRILTHSSAGADHQKSKVRGATGQAKDGRLQVLLVAAQVYKRDELCRTLTDFFHRPRLAVVQNLQ